MTLRALTCAAAAAATVAAAAAAFAAATGLVHCQRSTIDLMPVQGFDGTFGRRAIGHFDKTETPGATAHAVGNYVC